MVDRAQLASDLQSVEGKVVARPVRSHGSMFLLDLGKLSKQPGEPREHGEWCFVFEQARWSFSRNHDPIISSTDDPGKIDEAFGRLNLETVTEISWPQQHPQKRGLRIAFSNGLILRATSNLDPSLSAEDQWVFFTPFGRVWTAKSNEIELDLD